MSKYQELLKLLGYNFNAVRIVVEYVTGLKAVSLRELRVENRRSDGVWPDQTVLKYRPVHNIGCEVSIIKYQGQPCVWKERWPLETPCQVDRELEVLHMFGSHPSLVRPFGFTFDEWDDEEQEEEKKRFIVHGLLYPVEGNSNLSDINRKQILAPSSSELLSFLEQILSALDHLHSHRIIHHDVCSENIIIQTKPISAEKHVIVRVKLGDLGVAECVNQNGHGSEEFRFTGRFQNEAPEQKDEKSVITTKVRKKKHKSTHKFHKMNFFFHGCEQLDMFGFRLIAIYLATVGRNDVTRLFQMVRIMDSFKQVVNSIEEMKSLKASKLFLQACDEFEKELWPVWLWDWIDKCHASDPNDRPSAREFLAQIQTSIKNET